MQDFQTYFLFNLFSDFVVFLRTRSFFFFRSSEARETVSTTAKTWQQIMSNIFMYTLCLRKK